MKPVKVVPNGSGFWVTMLVLGAALASIVALDAQAGGRMGDSDESGPSTESTDPDVDEQPTPTPEPTPI